MKEPKVNMEDLRQLIGNKIQNGERKVLDAELISLFPDSDWMDIYRPIYAWYHKGTSFIASIMASEPHASWRIAYNEMRRTRNYYLLKRNKKTKNNEGHYKIITSENDHDDYESVLERMLEYKLSMKYTLTDGLRLKKPKEYQQILLEEYNKSKKRK